jgi:hypothetical protein
MFLVLSQFLEGPRVKALGPFGDNALQPKLGGMLEEQRTFAAVDMIG